jgi:hypothetical protein
MQLRTKERAYNNAVLSYLNVVPNGCGLDDGARTNVNVITDFHWVVVEVTTVRLIRWSAHRTS